MIITADKIYWELILCDRNACNQRQIGHLQILSNWISVLFGCAVKNNFSLHLKTRASETEKKKLYCASSFNNSEDLAALGPHFGMPITGALSSPVHQSFVKYLCPFTRHPCSLSCNPTLKSIQLRDYINTRYWMSFFPLLM